MYNILVCDDDKEIVQAIEIYLAKEGYNAYQILQYFYKNVKFATVKDKTV